jgi:hypothetical protein
MEFDFALNYEQKYLDDPDLQSKNDIKHQYIDVFNIIESTVISGVNISLKNDGHRLDSVEYEKLKKDLIEGIHSLYSDECNLISIGII